MTSTPSVEALPPLVPIPRVEAMLQGVVSRNTLHRWLRSGRIKSIQPGGRRGKRFIPKAEVERLLNGDSRRRSHLAAHHAGDAQ